MERGKIRFGITPCPNDTFSYRALIEGIIPNPFEFVFEDIETLNIWAESEKFPITKLSFPAFMENADKYSLLNAGAALGIGTGPVLVKRCGIGAMSPESIVAVPGARTTAALLLKFYSRNQLGSSSNLTLYSEYFRAIIESLVSGRFNYGVLIHEGRFVYKNSSLELERDLGEFWTTLTGLPVPLGCICANKSCPMDKSEIEELIRSSIKYAFEHETETYPFVSSYAQYLQPEVLKRHIYAFVNEYSYDISKISDSLIENLRRGM